MLVDGIDIEPVVRIEVRKAIRSFEAKDAIRPLRVKADRVRSRRSGRRKGRPLIKELPLDAEITEFEDERRLGATHFFNEEVREHPDRARVREATEVELDEIREEKRESRESRGPIVVIQREVLGAPVRQCECVADVKSIVGQPEPLSMELAHFLDCIRDGTEPLTGLFGPPSAKAVSSES